MTEKTPDAPYSGGDWLDPDPGRLAAARAHGHDLREPDGDAVEAESHVCTIHCEQGRGHYPAPVPPVTDLRGIQDTSNGRCDEHLNVEGEDFRCDLAADHPGWAHSNRDAQAIWSPAPVPSSADDLSDEAYIERHRALVEAFSAEQSRRTREAEARAEAAEREVADLRAGIEALADESDRRGSPFVYATEIRALLAGAGGRPGEVCEHAEHAVRGDGRVGRHFNGPDPAGYWVPCPAPVVPDSTGLREALEDLARRVRRGPHTTDGEGRLLVPMAEVFDVLAVVGQGVTAEQAWDEGYRQHQDQFYGAPVRPNPYRAVVRPDEQEEGL